MSTIEIRFAQPKDIDAIVELCKLHAEFEQADYNSEHKADLLTQQLFKAPSILKCLVVEKDYEIVGYASFMKQYSTWETNFYVYLDCLYLKEGVRGFGLGKRIMHKIREFAFKENCMTIQWQTPIFNEKAIDFYRQIGAFSKTKKRFFWNLIDKK